MSDYLSQQVGDSSHREVIGPLLPGRGASGVVRHEGRVIAEWGDPTVPEMVFSATKSIVSLVAGVAYDSGQLDVDARVADSVSLPAFDGGRAGSITWRHLLQQTSQWSGELWGKPVAVDAPSHEGSDLVVAAPGGRPVAFGSAPP